MKEEGWEVRNEGRVAEEEMSIFLPCSIVQHYHSSGEGSSMGAVLRVNERRRMGSN
jgi:hypothetical protein